MTDQSVELVCDTTECGSPRYRACDEHGHPIAGAVCVDGRWSVFAYRLGPPVTPLETTDEQSAQGWVRWIAEQVVAGVAV